MTNNGYIDHLKRVKDEGKKAAQDGLNSWDNPYDFVLEASEAYAWEDGFKREAA